jgi:hypothetical protein
VPAALHFDSLPLNPGLSRPQGRVKFVAQGYTIGTGVSREYYHANTTNLVYPPRPTPGSVLDLDVIQDYCAFPEQVDHSLDPMFRDTDVESSSMLGIALRSYD